MMTLMEAMQQVPHAPESMSLLMAKVIVLLIVSPLAVLGVFVALVVWYGLLKNMALRRGWSGFYWDLRSLIDWMAAE